METVVRCALLLFTNTLLDKQPKKGKSPPPTEKTPRKSPPKSPPKPKQPSPEPEPVSEPEPEPEPEADHKRPTSVTFKEEAQG